MKQKEEIRRVSACTNEIIFARVWNDMTGWLYRMYKTDGLGCTIAIWKPSNCFTLRVNKSLRLNNSCLLWLILMTIGTKEMHETIER